MTWEELRTILNSISEGENKSSLGEVVSRMGIESWCLDLMVSATTGKLCFVDAMAEAEADEG